MTYLGIFKGEVYPRPIEVEERERVREFPPLKRLHDAIDEVIEMSEELHLKIDPDASLYIQGDSVSCIPSATCAFCGKPIEGQILLYSPVAHHPECLKCPECGEQDMLVWKNHPPYLCRCLNCLHKFNLLKEITNEHRS